MMIKRTGFAILAGLSVVALPLAVASTPGAGNGKVEMTQGKVEFYAIGKPAFLKIHGLGEAPQGTFTIRGAKVAGRISFALRTLDTGIELRDRHMKEKYLELGKYPDATLEIQELTLPRPLPEGDFAMADLPFEGPLTLHGSTRPVKGSARIARAGGQLTVNAEFALKVSDYSIAIPSYAGISVADEVKVNVESRSSVEASK